MASCTRAAQCRLACGRVYRLQSQSPLRFFKGYGCGLLRASLEQGHQPGIGTSPGDLAVEIINGYKKKLADVRHPDYDVVDSSLIEQSRDVR